jgi:hypothetical protein
MDCVRYSIWSGVTEYGKSKGVFVLDWKRIVTARFGMEFTPLGATSSSLMRVDFPESQWGWFVHTTLFLFFWA